MAALDGEFAKGYYRKACAHEKLKEYGPAYDAYKGATPLSVHFSLIFLSTVRDFPCELCAKFLSFSV